MRPFDIKPKALRLGDSLAKGDFKEDFTEAFRCYIPRSDLDTPSSNTEPDIPPAKI